MCENFCGIMRKFSLPWQQGSVEANLNDTTADFVKPIPGPVFCKGRGRANQSSVKAEVEQIFVFKYSNFRYLGNRGWSERSFDDTIKLADPENLPLVQDGRISELSATEIGLQPMQRH